MCYKDTESHTGNIKYPFRHNKTHREEKVGCWNERQDDQRQSLRKKTKRQFRDLAQKGFPKKTLQKNTPPKSYFDKHQ